MINETDKFQEAPPIEVPIDQLSEDVLQNLVEEFVLREGTDYGAQEISLEKKKEQVLKQLENEDIKIIFDPDTESVTLMTTQQFKKASHP